MKLDESGPQRHVWQKQTPKQRFKDYSKIRVHRAFKALKNETRQYFYNTSLHGFKYITAPETTTIEKCIWILICAMGTVFCVTLMCLVWQRFQENPTVTTIDTTTHPVWELPFPAVTICNFNKIYLPKVPQLTEDFKKLGLNDTQIDDFIKSLPKLIRPEYINVDVAPGMRALADLGYTIEEIMHLLMQPCDKLLVKCTWLGQTYDCSRMFQTIKSVEGFCCAFNYHALATDFQISLGNSQNPVPEVNTPSSTSPKTLDWIPGVNEIQMVTGSGKDVGLSLIIDVESHFYSGATRPYVGASILIHDPEDFPEISLLTALSEPGREVDIAITGTIIQSENNVRLLNIEQRKCWFDDEIRLKSSVKYSYQTCVTECKITHIKNLCNCIPFYYPVFFSTARMCDLSDVKCMTANRRVLSSLQNPVDGDDNVTRRHVDCNCLPQCTDRWYTLITETADLPTNKNELRCGNSQYYSYDLGLQNLSAIDVYFRDISCLKYRKEVLLTWDGFFAAFGGIFGLCLGGSVISLLELLYYYCVRIFHRKKQQSAILAVKSISSKLQDYGFKMDKNKNEKLKDSDILTKKIYKRPTYYAWGDSTALSTQLKAFRNSTTLVSNELSNQIYD